MLADFGEAAFFMLLLAILATYSGGRKLTSNMEVAMRNLHGYCTVKQTYENVLSNAVKVTNSL